MKINSNRTQLEQLLTAKIFALISVTKNFMGMNPAPLQPVAPGATEECESALKKLCNKYQNWL